MSRNQKLLWSLLTVVVMGSLAAFGTFSAFSHSTSNPGNNFDIGTVNISDNDAGGALYEVPNAGPGTTDVSCIEVTYGGTIEADVRLYNADDIDPAAGDLVNLKIEKGTGSPFATDCTGFVADQDNAELYDGTLDDFQVAHNSWATGLQHYPATASGGAAADATEWVFNKKVVYRFTTEFPEPDPTVVDNTANEGVQPGYTPGTAGYTSNEHTYTWEARNQ